MSDAGPNISRLSRFRQNRRGWIALWILAILSCTSMMSHFIANDKPIAVYLNGKLYAPIVTYYSEQQFGGDFDQEMNYRSPEFQMLIENKGWAIWPPIRFCYDTVNENLQQSAPTPPSPQNWLGTDDQGRDVAARLIYGLRTSILFGLCITVFSTVIAIILGATQGYFAGSYDLFFQRFIEIWSGMPILFLLIILGSFVQPSFGWLFFTILLFSWMGLAHVVRAEFLRTRNFDYVRAAQVLGVSHVTIILRHILPNAAVATLTYMPFILCGAITTLTSLDFLGFGLPPGSPSLGELVAQAKNNLHAPWLGITVFIVLSTLLTVLIFIGEAVRDILSVKSNHLGLNNL